MKIGIVGCSGNLGSYLIGRLNNENIDSISKIGRGLNADYPLELTHPERFDYSVLKQIDIIIFTAAISGPDQCANEYEKCWKINVEGTRYFIQRAMDIGCKVLFFSSDAVYGDIQGGIYCEESETNAITPYGKMKKAIEDEFKYNVLFKALRLSYVVSIEDRFVSYCLKCISKNIVADVFHPFYRNCIMRRDVGSIIIWLIDHWDDFRHTFLNAVGLELVSRIRIADEINRIVDAGLKYNIVRPEKKFYFNRPMITQVESLYLDKILKRMCFTKGMQMELKKENMAIGRLI
jgi:dTDP-4-dehydrorhamnose reductase